MKLLWGHELTFRRLMSDYEVTLVNDNSTLSSPSCTWIPLCG